MQPPPMDTGNPNDRKFDMGRMQRNEKIQYYWCMPPHSFLPAPFGVFIRAVRFCPHVALFSRFAEAYEPYCLLLQ